MKACSATEVARYIATRDRNSICREQSGAARKGETFVAVRWPLQWCDGVLPSARFSVVKFQKYA